MKNLIISLSLISTLLMGQSALAQEEIKSVADPFEVIVVVGAPDVDSFEIYSLEAVKSTLESVMELMRDDISSSFVHSPQLLVRSEATKVRAASDLFH